MGYGMIENCKGKGAAFEKAKKEAATDGLKRALRNFGNVLGNCLYDKEYLKKVGNMKVKPTKFDESRLHRHPDFAPLPVKDELELVKKDEHKTPKMDNVSRTATGKSVISTSFEVEDEFGGNLFDGVEINEDHGHEFTFETVPGAPVPKLLEGPRPADPAAGPVTNRTNPGLGNAPIRQPVPRVQSMPAMRAPNGANQPPQQQQQQNQGPSRTAPQQVARGPQTPNPQQNNGRPDLQRPGRPPPTVDIHAPPKPPVQPPQQQNPPLRPTPPQVLPPNQAAPPKPAGSSTSHRPPVGFVTSRAAELMQNSESTASLSNLPAFNPHAESPLPKDQRTPGIDHTRSMKITRESVGIPTPNPQPQPQEQQAQQGQGQQGFRPVGGGSNRAGSNFVNPHQDVNRRIGMPGAHAMSPLANRSAYKPPGMVGGVKRPPLTDVSNQNGSNGDGPEPKKPKLEANGVENVAVGNVVTS